MFFVAMSLESALQASCGQHVAASYPVLDMGYALKAKMAGDRGHCLVITTVSDGASRGAEKRKMHPKAYWSNEIP